MPRHPSIMRESLTVWLQLTPDLKIASPCHTTHSFTRTSVQLLCAVPRPGHSIVQASQQNRLRSHRGRVLRKNPKPRSRSTCNGRGSSLLTSDSRGRPTSLKPDDGQPPNIHLATVQVDDLSLILLGNTKTTCRKLASSNFFRSINKPVGHPPTGFSRPLERISSEHSGSDGHSRSSAKVLALMRIVCA